VDETALAVIAEPKKARAMTRPRLRSVPFGDQGVGQTALSLVDRGLENEGVHTKPFVVFVDNTLSFWVWVAVFAKLGTSAYLRVLSMPVLCIHRRARDIARKPSRRAKRAWVLGGLTCR